MISKEKKPVIFIETNEKSQKVPISSQLLKKNLAISDWYSQKMAKYSQKLPNWQTGDRQIANQVATVQKSPI